LSRNSTIKLKNWEDNCSYVSCENNLENKDNKEISKKNFLNNLTSSTNINSNFNNNLNNLQNSLNNQILKNTFNTPSSQANYNKNNKELNDINKDYFNSETNNLGPYYNSASKSNNIYPTNYERRTNLHNSNDPSDSIKLIETQILNNNHSSNFIKFNKYARNETIINSLYDSKESPSHSNMSISVSSNKLAIQDNSVRSTRRTFIKKFTRSYTSILDKSDYKQNNFSKYNQGILKSSIINRNNKSICDVKLFATQNPYNTNSNNLFGSQSNHLINEDPLGLKNVSKGSYENFILKYNQKKDKIFKYYIILNNKMMLYFKNSCKTKYRGLHYLSDSFVEVSFDKTKFINSNGIRYFFIQLKIKESTKTFISKNEFEIRKWFEVLKKTINPHKSRQIKDFYSMREKICEGKYGVVKRAFKKNCKDELAIKIINLDCLENPKQREFFEKEIEILQHCNHDKILKYKDYFIEDNIHLKGKHSYIYIVMEYLSGGNLAQLIKKNGPLYESNVISIAWEIAKGLDYLHKIGIVHRDIKPENIVFDSNHKLRIVDFGLSQIISFGEYLNESYGTFYYASPEIHRKTKHDKSTDIWSFGILLYYILTLDFPFDRDIENAHIIIGDLDNEFDLYRNINFTNASTPLKDLIKGCLRKKMEERLKIEHILQHKVFFKINDNKERKNKKII